MDADEYEGKESRLDILGRTASGTKVNIEMQVNALAAMGERSVFYWARNYADLKRGEEYDQLNRTVAINILGFNLFDGSKYPNMHSCFGIYDVKTGCQLTDKLEIHFLELLKFKSKNVKEMNRMEKWAAYFSPSTPDEELAEIAASEAAIQEAMEVEDVFTKDEVAKRAYEKAEKFRRDQAAQLSYARQEERVKAVSCFSWCHHFSDPFNDVGIKRVLYPEPAPRFRVMVLISHHCPELSWLTRIPPES